MTLITTKAPDPAAFLWAVSSDINPKNETLDVANGQLFIVFSKGQIISIVETGKWLLKDVLSALNHQNVNLVSICCFSTKIFGALGWGTTSPLQIVDNQGDKIVLKGHGTFGLALWNPKTCWRAIGGIHDKLSAADLQVRCRSIILAALQNQIHKVLNEGELNLEQIVSMPAHLLDRIQADIKSQMLLIGLELNQFNISNLSAP